MRLLDEGAWRRSVAGVVAGVLAVSMLAFTAGSGAAVSPAQNKASQSVSQEEAQAAPAETVLASRFGRMKSKVAGEFGRNGTVEGTFTPKRFLVRQGEMFAVGKLRATMIRGNGDVVGSAVEKIRIPVRKANGEPANRVSAARTCDILNLVLGPLDLNLLGLEVSLNRVVLDIIARTGPGNLLGNLLCAVAGLLDRNGFLTEVSQVLNAVLGLLRR